MLVSGINQPTSNDSGEGDPTAQKIATRVPIGLELLEQEKYPFDIPSSASAPQRLRLEIDIWLCRNRCAGWRMVKVEEELDRPDLSFRCWSVEHFIEFADPNDAFWFRMTWT
jgi:hypothetical protein